MSKLSPKSLFVLCLLLSNSLIPNFCQAQGARVRQGTQSAGNRTERANPDEQENRDSDADNPKGRAEWFRSGRHAAGERTSDLLHRAYVRKQHMAVSSQGGEE